MAAGVQRALLARHAAAATARRGVLVVLLFCGRRVRERSRREANACPPIGYKSHCAAPCYTLCAPVPARVRRKAASGTAQVYLMPLQAALRRLLFELWRTQVAPVNRKVANRTAQICN
ncbi:hypothetical protein T492DRAFT_831467 [Pavlovales sp. CCMP2436]|nr:hypothetical protein T492DRAFT_831467 [Pavlovales sp. CCMP2436]